MEFAVTSLFYLFHIPFFMQTPNGQNVKQAIVLLNISDDTRHVSEVEKLLTLKHLIFLDNIRDHGKDAIVKSLRDAHDWLAYVSEMEIDQKSKDMLFDLKLLGDWLEEI